MKFIEKFQPLYHNLGDFIMIKKAEELYLYIVDLLKGKGIKVETGIFGAEMKVTLVNEGPFTIVLDL